VKNRYVFVSDWEQGRI